jgi:hypothetical protein
MDRFTRIIVWWLVVVAGSSFAGAATGGAEEQPLLDHDLQVSLEPQRNRLTATDHIHISQNSQDRIIFELAGHLKVQAVSVNDNPADYMFSDGQIRIALPGDRHGHDVMITYSGAFRDQAPVQPLNVDNPGFGVTGSIDRRGTLLLAGARWYPQNLQGRSFYRLTVDAPAGVLAVTAGESLGHDTSAGRTLSRWRVEHPLNGLSLVAGDFIPVRRTFGRITVATYFTRELQDLSRDYLDASGRYLAFYDELFGPYPFGQFSIVENYFPTGYGFPSYTLMGRRVLRLPFIIHTSLGHEIAHCWWGNGVLVDPSQGNWCEGLTSYVADYLYRERSGAGQAHRLQWLRNYSDIVDSRHDFALTNFSSRTDPVTRAVGYDKAAMVFHMLRQKVGDNRFWKTLRTVYDRYRFKAINWGHWQAAFEASSDESLERFFQQWVHRAGAPRLALSDTRMSADAEGYTVQGILVQRAPYYDLDIDLVLESANGTTTRRFSVSGPRTPFTVASDSKPLRLSVDPQAHLFRRLSAQEIPPTVNSLKGTERLTVAVAAGLDKRWTDIAHRLCIALGADHAPIVREGELAAEAAADGHVLWIGMPSDPGRIPQTDGRFIMDDRGFSVSGKTYSRRKASFFGVFDAGDGSGRTVGLFLPESHEMAAVLSAKIPHYGKYSYLVFQGPRNQAKETWPVTQSPLIVQWHEGE